MPSRRTTWGPTSLRESCMSHRFRYTGTVNERAPDAAGRDARGRAQWPVRTYRLGHEPGDDLSASTTAEERIAMMWPLALEAWAVSGAEMPEYDRRSATVRKLFRRPA